MSHSNFLIISPRPGRAAPGKEEASHLGKDSKRLALLFPYHQVFSEVLKPDLFGRKLQVGGCKVVSSRRAAVPQLCGVSVTFVGLPICMGCFCVIYIVLVMRKCRPPEKPVLKRWKSCSSLWFRRNSAQVFL